MTPITLVMAYYENPGMLLEHYKLWRKLPAHLRDLLHVVIVDDGSPVAPAKPPVDMGGMSVQIYRIIPDVRWNQDAARNIGVVHAETNWVLLTDIDHMVPEDTWSCLLLRDYDPAVAYRFSRVSAPEMKPYKPHPNSWFMTRKLYDEVGGYDERFAGLYGTDGDFRDHVAERAQIVQLKEKLIRVPRTHIPDASTTTYLRKQPEDREGLDRVKLARMAEPDQRPLRYTFPFIRVYP